MVVAWIVLALGLLAFEVHHLAFYALFVAIGAAAAAVVAVVAPSAYVVQAAVAVGVAVVGIGPVRPYVSRVFSRRHDGHVGPGVHGGFVGQQVNTLDDVGPTGTTGHVRLAGERWLAVSGDDESIPPGTAVVVTAVRGTTLVVLPVDGPISLQSVLGPPSLDRSRSIAGADAPAPARPDQASSGNPGREGVAP